MPYPWKVTDGQLRLIEDKCRFLRAEVCWLEQDAIVTFAIGDEVPVNSLQEVFDAMRGRIRALQESRRRKTEALRQKQRASARRRRYRQLGASLFYKFGEAM